jgi:hypothetical protein
VATITVTHKGPAASVSYSTGGGTATPGSDYTPVSGTLSWGAGDSGSKTISVPIAADTVQEPNETVGLSLRPTKGTVAANPRATLTIIDNDGPARYSFATDNYAASEADGTKTIDVIRAGDTSTSADIGYSATGGTAPASNYSLGTASPLHFAAGDTTKQITVNLVNNSVQDGDRTLVLGLSGAANLQAPTSTTLTILDDDAPPTVQLDPAQTWHVSEGEGMYLVSIVRGGDPSKAVTVDLSTLDGSADAGDYTQVDPAATIQLDAGEGTPESGPVTYSIGITDDNVHEPDQAFTATLSNPTAPAILGASTTHDVTITDDDPVPTVSLGGVQITTDSNGNTVVTVSGSLSNPSSDPVTVQFSVVDPSTGRVIATGTITIPAGQTAGTTTIVLTPDQIGQAQSIVVYLTGASGALVDPAASSSKAPAASGSQSSSSTTGNGSGADGGNQVVAGARQSACGLTLKATKKQKLGKAKSLKLTLKAANRCQLTVATTITQLRSKSQKRQAQVVRALRLKGKNASLTLQPGAAKTVKVQFTKKTLNAITKALRARKNLVATVVVTERISASTVKQHTLKITIKR